MHLPLTFRASSADRTFECNGSILASPLVPQPPDSEDSLEGQVIHYEIARRTVAELGATPPEGGLVPPRIPKGYELPAFSKWIPDWALQCIREAVPPDWSLMVEVEIVETFALPRPVWVPVSELLSFSKSTVTPINGVPCVLVEEITLSGHLDWMAISPDGTQMRGGDWKSGRVGADAAEENWQASQYLLLAKSAWDSIASARFTLAQPRIDEENGIPRISHTELSGEELERLTALMVDRYNKALENRYETNSSEKACRYCPVALMRPWLCPSLVADNDFMKSKLTTAHLEQLRGENDYGKIADFVLTGRTLAKPVEAATELLKERVREQGYADSASGKRITIKKVGGRYSVIEGQEVAFMENATTLLADKSRLAKCVTYSLDALVDNVAEERNIPKTSKNDVSAKSCVDTLLKPLMVQATNEWLVIQ